MALATPLDNTGTSIVLSDLVALTRPRVLVLVLLTAPAGALLGATAAPAWGPLLGALAGTALLAAGCSALNAWWDADIDLLMARTADRPLPAGRLASRDALTFGLLLVVAGTGLVRVSGGAMAAAIAALTAVHYAGVYTLWLKRRTPQNIVIGGAAGATAPLIADAAVNGVPGIWSALLFVFVFAWTPVHFWAIALMRKNEYARAGVPMMPLVVGASGTRLRMLVYAIATVALSLLPWAAGVVGAGYGLVAVLADGWFLARVVRSMRLDSRPADRAAFFASVVYLTVIFSALTAAAALRIALG